MRAGHPSVGVLLIVLRTVTVLTCVGIGGTGRRRSLYRSPAFRYGGQLFANSLRLTGVSCGNADLRRRLGGNGQSPVTSLAPLAPIALFLRSFAMTLVVRGDVRCLLLGGDVGSTGNDSGLRRSRNRTAITSTATDGLSRGRRRSRRRSARTVVCRRGGRRRYAGRARARSGRRRDVISPHRKSAQWRKRRTGIIWRPNGGRGRANDAIPRDDGVREDLSVLDRDGIMLGVTAK